MGISRRTILHQDLIVKQFSVVLVDLYSVLAELCQTNLSLADALFGVGQNFDIKEIGTLSENGRTRIDYQMNLPEGEKLNFHIIKTEKYSNLAIRLSKKILTKITPKTPKSVDWSKEEEFGKFLKYNLLTNAQRFYILLAQKADENGFVEYYRIYREEFKADMNSTLYEGMQRKILVKRVEGRVQITEELKALAKENQKILQTKKRPLRKDERLIVELAFLANENGDLFVSNAVDKIYGHETRGLLMTNLIKQNILECYLKRRYRITPWGRKLAEFYKRIDSELEPTGK